MEMRLNFGFSTEQLAEEMTQLDHATFIKFVMDALDAFACAELDEELVACIWRGLDGCYDPGERRPTLASLLRQYPEQEQA